MAYLATLGPDATPTIVQGLPRPISACVMTPDPTSQDDLLAWNLGRSRAAGLGVAAPTAAEAAACTDLLRHGLPR